MHFRLNSINDINEVAKAFLLELDERRCLSFYGEMGAGKTTFIKALCQALQVTDEVNSPSFSIANEYVTPSGDTIYHFDFYRIKTLHEAYDMGAEDYFYSGNYCFIEWPEKIESILPENHREVVITLLDKGARLIELK